MATLQFKRGSTATLMALQTAPAAGEPIWDKELEKLKVGDGERLYSQLPYVGDVSGDEKSITASNNLVKIFGFDSALLGEAPVKSEDGKLEWKRVLTSDDIETIEATIVGDIQEYLDENVLPRISTIEDEIDDLDGRITNVTENIIPPISNAVSELDRRMDAVEETLADINPEALEEAIAEIREAVDTIEEYDERLDDIQADIGTIKNDITGIKNEDELQDDKLENHEERIQALEEGGGGGISPDDIFVIYGGDATHVLIDAHQAGGNNG